jgi:hypothetical protein
LSVAPDTVSADAAKLEKPVRVPPALRVSVPDVVSVPEPASVPPLRVRLPPLFARGPAPRGKLQVVTVLVPAVCVKVTRLNVLTEQASVAAVIPLKFTTPPLALKVGAPEIVNAPATLIDPDGAVNVPLESAKAELTAKVV